MTVPGRVTARNLIREASRLFDDTSNGLAPMSRRAWRGGFASGADWMRLALQVVRGEQPSSVLGPPTESDLWCRRPACTTIPVEPLPETTYRYQRSGVIKYTLASLVAALTVALAILTHQYYLAVLAIPAFYAVEVQMVFLFPLALSGCTCPFFECRRWTVRAGGTVAAMRVVMPLAAMMLFGGFVGQGFVRSWCIGCLAVCIWFERVRCEVASAAEPTGALQPATVTEAE